MPKQGAPRRYVLDAGALIAQERGDVRVAALFKVAATQHIGMLLPSVVLAQVWRNGTRQAGRLGAAVITSDSGDIAKLDPALPIVKV